MFGLQAADHLKDTRADTAVAAVVRHNRAFRIQAVVVLAPNLPVMADPE
jgi:hypothetical protein